MTKFQEGKLEPRISVLETTSEALQKELMALSNAVKEQGNQLTNAISNLATAHNAAYNTLADKIGAIGKTDWTTFWTMIATLILALGAISTPIWLNFAALEKAMNKSETQLIERIVKIENKIFK